MQTYRLIGSFAHLAVVVFGFQANAATLPITAGTIFGDYFYTAENEIPNNPSARIGVAGSAGQTGTWIMNSGDFIALTAPVTGIPQPSIEFGNGSGADGRLNMSGTGTQILMQGDQTGTTLQIGKRLGVGAVVIADGAEIIITDPSGVPGNSASIQLGLSGGDGNLTVSNANVDVSGAEGAYVFVGSRDGGSVIAGGQGSVLLNNGATMTVKALTKLSSQIGTEGAAVILGQEDGVQGNFEVTNGSSLSIEGERQSAGMSVGSEENSLGIFSVTNGGTVSLVGNSLNDPAPTDKNTYIEIGTKTGAVGRLNIDGPGSKISLNSVDAFIGLGHRGGYGEMNITNGGALSSTATSGQLRIGEAAPTMPNGGQGLVTVSGVGSKLDWSSNIVLGNQSGLNKSEGTLIINNSAEVTASNGVTIFEGGVVKGNGGILNANVTLNGGSIAPGLSPGLLTINGDLNIQNGSLDFEIASLINFDVLEVIGTIFASGPFDLNLMFTGGYMPGLGDSFNLFGSSTLDSSFESLFSLNVSGLSGGLSASYDPFSGGKFNIVQNVSTVPLPAGLPLLLGAFGILALSRRWS